MIEVYSVDNYVFYKNNDFTISYTEYEGSLYLSFLSNTEIRYVGETIYGEYYILFNGYRYVIARDLEGRIEELIVICKYFIQKLNLLLTAADENPPEPHIVDKGGTRKYHLYPYPYSAHDKVEIGGELHSIIRNRLIGYYHMNEGELYFPYDYTLCSPDRVITNIKNKIESSKNLIIMLEYMKSEEFGVVLM